MATQVPHGVSWKKVNAFRSYTTWFFWISVGGSLVLSLLDQQLVGWGNLLLEYLLILAISLYAVMDIYTDYYLVPTAEEQRRADFVDNVFGSKLADVNSVGYYTNDAVENGLLKVAANLFGNTLFTKRILDLMLTGKVVVPLLVILAVMAFALIGFDRQPIALTVLQTFFSSTVLYDLIKYVHLRNRIGHLYEHWKVFFHQRQPGPPTARETAQILAHWLEQETVLARTQVSLNSKLFYKHNPAISQQWEEIKQRLNIT